MSKLPADLERVLRDHSIIVPQDQAVFELVVSCIDTSATTASALTVEEWSRAWSVTAQKWLEERATRVRAGEALRRIEELAVDAKAELLTPQTSGDKRSVAHLLSMIEALAAVPVEEETRCVCGEINTRHCPVHSGVNTP